jgi:DNA-binding MarR family transcriptional regulator
MPHTPTEHLSSVRPDTLQRTLTYRLHLLHKLTDQTSQQAYPQATGLSLSAGRCLAAVGAFEPLSVKTLAERANLDKGQASRAAQALVEQGLVAKHNSPDDGRGVVLTLTEDGRQAWQRTMNLIHTRNQDIFGCLDEAEQTVLSQLLDRLIANAQHGTGL